MARKIGTGIQSFEALRTNGYFYVDKSGFVRDWWDEADQVTLICRPRRFGKTLNLDTVRCYLSPEFSGRGEELFGGLDAWELGPEAERDAFRAVQGTVPVIHLSFARVKQQAFDQMMKRLNTIMVGLCERHRYLRTWEGLTAADREALDAIHRKMDEVTCADVPHLLCDLLHRYWGTRPVVLIDEYDTPMQEAWSGGYWNEAVSFIRDLMNSTFKSNDSLGRGLITGVTRVSRESVFSDLNNLKVITTSSNKYQTCFGFTEAETFSALEEFGLGDLSDQVRGWYDGFTFGGVGSIYNPWSVTEFLGNGKFDAYWANTSSNALVSTIVRRGDNQLKQDFEALLQGRSVEKLIDEQVVFSELGIRPNAVWALLLAAGYVTAPGPTPMNLAETPRVLALTNHEVEATFDRMVEGWFGEVDGDLDEFCRAILAGDVETATDYLSDVCKACISDFDSGTKPSKRATPERFYHGLVLGLLAKLRGRYSVESNRESGYGRYDIALVPTDDAQATDPAVVIEFKVFDKRHEKTLEDTVATARAQIENSDYVTGLIERGIAKERIRILGIGFRGKKVLVG